MSKSPKDIALMIGGPVEEESTEGDEYETIASDIISAVESKDAKMLGSALKAFVSACEMVPHEEAEMES